MIEKDENPNSATKKEIKKVAPLLFRFPDLPSLRCKKIPLSVPLREAAKKV
jgi:hypothetical protein